MRSTERKWPPKLLILSGLLTVFLLQQLIVKLSMSQILPESMFVSYVICFDHIAFAPKSFCGFDISSVLFCDGCCVGDDVNNC